MWRYGLQYFPTRGTHTHLGHSYRDDVQRCFRRGQEFDRPLASGTVAARATPSCGETVRRMPEGGVLSGVCFVWGPEGCLGEATW